jgi:hypothetical protein
MSKAPSTSRPLDEKKLQQLVPPLTLAVNKKYMGNRTTPVPLPPAKLDTNFDNGKGYDHMEVRNLAPLLLQVSGGGTYGISVTDDQGGSLEFDIWLDPQQFPDRIPAEYAQHTQQGKVIPIPASQPVMQPMSAVAGSPPMLAGIPTNVEWVSQVPAGIPRIGAPTTAASQGYYVPPQPQAAQPFSFSTFPQGFGSFSSYPFATPYTPPAQQHPTSQEDARLRMLEDQNRQMREELLKRENQVERERELTAMREEVRKLSERPKDDAGMQALLGEIRALRETKSQDGTTAMMGFMAQMSQQSQQQAQQAAQQMTQLLGTLLPAMTQKPAGPDASMMMLVELFRASAEASKETTRMLSDQARDRERTAVGPRDVIEMSERLNQANGAGALLHNVSDAYQSVFGMTKTMMELWKENMGGSGPGPVQEMVGMTLQRGSDILEKYIQMKRDVSLGEAKVFEAQARANAAAAQPVQVPPQPQPQRAPAAAPPPGMPRPTHLPGVEKTAAQQEIEAREVQLFGPAVEVVQRLRLGVKDQKINPDEVVAFVQQAINVIQQKQWVVPALDLFHSEQIQTFVEVLIPNAPQAFIVAVVQRLYALKRSNVVPPPANVAPASASQLPEEEGEEDGVEEEEEEDGEE